MVRTMRFKHGFLFMCGAFAALAVILLIIGSTSAQNTQPAVNMSIYTGTISVSGTGYVYVEPDMAKVRIGVTTEATTSTQAMGDNANAMDKVISAIRAQGIPASDIKTSTVSLQPKYEYQYPTGTDKSGAPTAYSTRIVGYTATNTVTVTVRDISKVGAVIDAGYNGGANQIQGVTFQLSDEKSATVYKQALEKAVAEAKDKAKVIASAADVGEIKLKTISESGQYYPVAYDAMEGRAMAAGAVAPTPVSPGQQQVSATVSLTYVYIPQ
ncbi:MAG: oxidative stress defense protein [Methanocella sp. PtaU1.Bin125]|nr:MAG: oxidative stress defense protein [Methanocella sp. PtaU1.Bin125]